MAYFSTLQWHLLLFYTDMSLPITLDILIMDKKNYWLSILNTLNVTKIHNNFIISTPKQDNECEYLRYFQNMSVLLPNKENKILLKTSNSEIVSPI